MKLPEPFLEVSTKFEAFDQFGEGRGIGDIQPTSEELDDILAIVLEIDNLIQDELEKSLIMVMVRKSSLWA